MGVNWHCLQVKNKYSYMFLWCGSKALSAPEQVGTSPAGKIRDMYEPTYFSDILTNLWTYFYNKTSYVGEAID